MKDWKELLRDIRRNLREVATSDKRGDKPVKVDFDPPKSWLTRASTDERSAQKRINPSNGVDRSSGSARSTSGPWPGEPSASRGSSRSTVTPSNTLPRKTDPQNRIAPTDRKPERQPVVHKSAVPPPTFRPRIDDSLSLSMPDWAETGKSLQHPEALGGAPSTVRLGIDFGTAFTKVALRAGPDLVIVDWSSVTSDDSPDGRWVMPGFVYRGSSGEFGWQRLEEGEWQTNLKLPLVNGVGNEDCPCASLAYMALVIRYARAFLYRHPAVGRKVASRSLRWELNLGCPTVPHESQEIVEHFRLVARTAWWLAGQDDLDENILRDAWNRRDLHTGLETEPSIVPEFVAQIAGYLKSPHVNEGLHALVDVGAATLDVAMYNIVLSRDGGTPRIPIFFSAVKPLGTHFLAHRRHEVLGLELLWDDASPVETDTDFAKRHGRDVGEIDRIDGEYAREVSRCIANVMNATRTNAWGNPSSAAWHEGLPVFVTGGGATCDVYRRALQDSEAAIKAMIGSPTRFRFILMDLARAELLSTTTVATNRLTVAIGLTEDAEDIARIVPHRDIEPITTTSSDPRPDRDELYPK